MTVQISRRTLAKALAVTGTAAGFSRLLGAEASGPLPTSGGWSFPERSSFPSGVDGEQMHSVFGQLYQRTIWEEYRKRRQSTYGLVRSSGALNAPCPFVLYSDLYDHREYIRALVNSGFSALLWCPEVRQAVSHEDLVCPSG